MRKIHEDKVALITGGNSGLGLATAITLVKEGAKVAIVGRKEESLKSAVKKIQEKESTAEVIYIKADVSSEEDTKKYVNETLEKYGRIDYFFNNAGIEGLQKPITEYDMDVYRSVIDINLMGVVYGLKYVISVMEKQGTGVVVNTSSVGGLRGVVDQSAYVASKHAVAGITKNMAAEYATKGIRVNSISPGAIKTPMVEQAFIMMNPENPKKAEEEFALNNPTKRLGVPEEVADVVSFLFSDKSRYIYGQMIAIDGGQSNQY